MCGTGMVGHTSKMNQLMNECVSVDTTLLGKDRVPLKPLRLDSSPRGLSRGSGPKQKGSREQPEGLGRPLSSIFLCIFWLKIDK